MADEEFGAGLDTAGNAPAVPPVQSAAPDEFMTQFRTVVSGIPEDLGREQLTDHLLEMQTRAERATELEKKIAEYEAKFALSATQQSVTPTKPVEQQAPEPDFELPWKPVRVDPALKAMVKIDPESGGYVAKNPTSMTHLKAAEEMNQHVAYANQFVEAFINDPEGVATTLTKRQIAQLEKKFAEQLAEVKSQFQPIQEQVAATRVQSETAIWVEANYDKLYAGEGQLTPLGTIVDGLMQDGYDPAKALAIAEKAFPATAKAGPAQKPVLAKPEPVKPNRLVDNIGNRMRRNGQAPPDQSAFDGASGKFRPSWNDVEERVRARHGDN